MVTAAATLEKATAGAMSQRGERLGTVYNYLAGIRALPFGKWAIPALRTDHGPFLQALGYVYLVDERGARNIGRSTVADRTVPYRADYEVVVPAIRAAALEYARDALNQEENELTTLLTKLTQDPQEPERLQAVARQIARRVRLEPTWGERALMFEGKLDEAKWNQAKRKEVAREIRASIYSDLTALFAHPEGVAIVAAFSKSAADGAELAARHVQRSVDALRDYRREINSAPDDIWRYPFFAVGGAKRLGLDEIPGFKEYITSIARVLAPGNWEERLGFASMALACLGLVFTGPVGLVVIGAADLALASASTALAYMRERERELAGTASQFRAAGDAFAVSAGYRDTVLSGAAAILSAIAFFKATREFRELIKPRLTTSEFVGAPRSPISGEARGSRLSAPAAESTAGRATRQPTRQGARGTAAGRESAALEATSAAGRGVPRGFAAGVDAQAQMVLQAPLPQGLRANLESQIAELERVTKGFSDEAAAIQQELRDIADQLSAADLLGRTQTEEYRALLRRRAGLREQQKTFLPLDDLGIKAFRKKQELNALLRVDQQGYFKDLTDAARRRPEYVSVQTGDLDEQIFLVTTLETEVDHLFPRFEIWNTPGFKENLTRDQQIFLFAYADNLKKMPWALNNQRGIRRYKDLPSRVWGPYVVDDAALLRLDREALAMRDQIVRLINEPGNSELWRRRGYLPRH